MKDAERILYCSACGERMVRPPRAARVWVCPAHATHHPRFDPDPPAAGGTNTGGPLPGDDTNPVGRALDRARLTRAMTSHERKATEAKP